MQHQSQLVARGVQLKTHTTYMTFNTTQRRELIRITGEVQAAVDEAGIEEGMV